MPLPLSTSHKNTLSRWRAACACATTWQTLLKGRTSRCPFCAAMKRAVALLPARAFTAAPARIRDSLTRTWLLEAALCSGVSPTLVFRATWIVQEGVKLSQYPHASLLVQVTLHRLNLGHLACHWSGFRSVQSWTTSHLTCIHAVSDVITSAPERRPARASQRPRHGHSVRPHGGASSDHW